MDAYYPGGRKAQRYCLGDTIKHKLANLKAQDKQPELTTVGYILETARNWHGPNGDFRLRITNKNSFASFCVPEGLKAVGDGSWQGKNFVPKTDLKVVFY